MNKHKQQQHKPVKIKETGKRKTKQILICFGVRMNFEREGLLLLEKRMKLMK